MKLDFNCYLYWYALSKKIANQEEPLWDKAQKERPHSFPRNGV
jgi:hypothetical protein